MILKFQIKPFAMTLFNDTASYSKIMKIIPTVKLTKAHVGTKSMFHLFVFCFKNQHYTAACWLV